MQSLFGLPNYQAELQGMLKQPDGLMDGCGEYPSGFVPPSEGGRSAPPTIIALVARGNCTFGQKAVWAQKAGASAIIVYNRDIDPDFLPKMAGGKDTESLVIPGMLINHWDGGVLLAGLAKWQDALRNKATKDVYYKGVWLSLSYWLVAPDDRIEWDLYMIPDEPAAVPFLQSFKPALNSIGDRGLFTPHYKLIDGDMVDW